MRKKRDKHLDVYRMYLKNKIMQIMNSDDAESLFVSSLLSGTSELYGAGVSFRNSLYDKGIKSVRSLPCPVVSIGNIAVGGTGKTPMTLFLSRGLRRKGLKPVILSRGYGGRDSDKGGMVSDGHTVFMEPRQSGDEPFLMASLLKSEGVPVFIGRDRYTVGMEAFQRFNPDIFILDDGFQHRNLNRNSDIVLLDSEKPFGNGHLLPRGILREPISSLERGDVFILTRSSLVNKALDVKRFTKRLIACNANRDILKKPVFVCSHKPVIRGIVKKNTSEITTKMSSDCMKKDIVVFSGIAKNDDFRRGLIECGFDIKFYFEYDDHHPYSRTDIHAVVSKASEMGVCMMATTEKDYVRFHKDLRLPMDLIVMGVELDFGPDESNFISTVCNLLYK